MIVPYVRLESRAPNYTLIDLTAQFERGGEGPPSDQVAGSISPVILHVPVQEQEMLELRA